MSTPTDIPDAQTLAAAGELDVLNLNGEKVKFGSVLEPQGKTIVVFIRHFFCGTCQAYIKNLVTVPKGALDAANTKLVVIGCGEWNPIKDYAEITGFEGPIYADPSRTLFRKLGMDIEHIAGTPAGQQKRSYVPGIVSNVLLSIWRGPLRHPNLIGKQGNISQLGGDFVFGPGGDCSFAHRMQNSEDHIEVMDLMKAAGVEFP